MITEIEVDGFRSLSNFRMEIKPGLNILVGPNGAGKTNIVTFFEFLSEIFSEGLNAAVDNSGGTASVFQKLDTGNIAKDMKIKISGEKISKKSSPINVLTGKSSDETSYIKYEYTSTISFSNKLDIVYFHDEGVKVSISKEQIKSDQKWDFMITSHQDAENDSRNSVSFEKINFSKASDLFKSISPKNGNTKSEKLNVLKGFIESYFLGIDMPLMLYIDHLFLREEDIPSDLRGGQSLNISPTVTKTPEDSATPPRIRENGRGVASTLYALQKKKKTTPSAPLFQEYLDNSDEKTLSRIVDYINLVNPEITGLEVEKDHQDNRLKIHVTMKGYGDNVKIPFSFMSDGTVKWIALVTAIFTNRNMFAIEEPENFIHPMMQKEILNLMRDVREPSNRGRFILMTTHSESLLNAASPDEIVVVSMNDGITKARRLENKEDIQREINESGFGLGEMYLSGILNDA